MDTNFLIVVGDRFSGFASTEHVVQQSHMGHELERRQGEPTAVVAGQGLTRAAIREIDGLFSQFPGTYWLETESFGLASAPENLCHKTRPENRLASQPHRMSDQHMQLDLLVHNSNELMLDHLTGQHIQGMVLVEAARQSFLAVTEQFHAEDDERYYFVINRMDTRFHSFVFPLGATIDYQIHSLETNQWGSIASTATINFHQCSDRPATTCQVAFTAYPTEYLGHKEQQLAANRVTRFIDELDNADSQLSA